MQFRDDLRNQASRKKRFEAMKESFSFIMKNFQKQGKIFQGSKDMHTMIRDYFEDTDPDFDPNEYEEDED